ncbi:MAG: hypothetical protein CR994_08145 [Maribacter sp.]|nr:MAG: hypothetical protein CR994_08145 [Maribacter sp.]
MGKFGLRFLNGSLFTFIILVIMNPIGFIGGVSSIGGVGKFGFSMTFIAFVVVALNKSKFKVKLLNKTGYPIIFFIKCYIVNGYGDRCLGKLI